MFIKNNVTGSYPLVIHAPDESEIWHDIMRRFNAMPCHEATNSDQLLIITWNNFKTSPLEECLEKRKIPFKAMGKEVTVWNNLQKFNLNLDAIKYSNCKYAMGLDAHDVLFIGDPAEAVRRFEETDCDLLFNCETNFYPDFPIDYYVENKAFQTKVGKGKYRYLNSGSWIGKSEFCKEFFEECRKVRLWEMFDCTGRLNLYNCDQSVVHSIFKKYHPRVQLDYSCRIFFNISLIDRSEIGFLKWQ